MSICATNSVWVNTPFWIRRATKALNSLGYERHGFGWGITIAAPVTDKNVEVVREKLRSRAEIGLAKYGVTTEREDLTRKQWPIRAQEESLDLAVYLQRLISEEP